MAPARAARARTPNWWPGHSTVFTWTRGRCIARWRGIASATGSTCQDAKAVAAACRKWKAVLHCVDTGGLRAARLLVDGYFPEKEIRTGEVSAAVPHVAAVPKAREWMVKRQRECLQFGNLVMEGRDIGTNVFPETDFKFYLDAQLEERSRRRAADGVRENLAMRDQRDSQRAVAPLMVPLGAKVINNSNLTSEQTSGLIIAEVRKRLAEQ